MIKFARRTFKHIKKILPIQKWILENTLALADHEPGSIDTFLIIALCKLILTENAHI